MRIFSNENVYDSALERIRYLFDEFPNIVVGFSGGKDSTAVLNLTIKVAKEKNRLPVKVLFVDQEAEWQGTIDYVTYVMTQPEVEPMWFQMPMVITNNASSYNRYNYCWNEEEKDNWIHPKHPLSIKENKYGTDRFHELFGAIFNVEFKNKKTCYIAGVRTEESPKRYVSLTQGITYKWITWGTVLSKKNEHYTFYPLYDWSYTDIWKYLQDEKIPYNKIYDEMYRHGVKVNDMRISNLHHETAIQSLLLVQEIEPATWNKIANRIDGANTIKHIKKNSFACPKELPSMFESWEEYALHLAENIIQDQKNKDELYKRINPKKEIYSGNGIKNHFWRTIINTILSSDWDFTKIANWEMAHGPYNYRQYKQGKIKKEMLHDTSLFTSEELLDITRKINGTIKETN